MFSRGFADAGEINNGDAVVRYDQLAGPLADCHRLIFRRLPNRTNTPPAVRSGGPEPSAVCRPCRENRSAAQPLYQPARPNLPEEEIAARGQRRGSGTGQGTGRNARFLRHVLRRQHQLRSARLLLPL